jgi:hypothetical protein
MVTVNVSPTWTRDPVGEAKGIPKLPKSPDPEKAPLLSPENWPRLKPPQVPEFEHNPADALPLKRLPKPGPLPFAPKDPVRMVLKVTGISIPDVPCGPLSTKPIEKLARPLEPALDPPEKLKFGTVIAVAAVTLS